MTFLIFKSSKRETPSLGNSHGMSPSAPCLAPIMCALVYVCLCAFYWGSSLCTFALKQISDFNWRDPTLSVTKRRNWLNIISKLNPQTIQHITFILSLSHTHSDRFLIGMIHCTSVKSEFYIFSVLKIDCAKGLITVLVWLVYSLYFFISFILGVFLRLCPIVLKHAAWFQLQPNVKQQCPMLPLINLVSNHTS